MGCCFVKVRNLDLTYRIEEQTEVYEVLLEVSFEVFTHWNEVLLEAGFEVSGELLFYVFRPANTCNGRTADHIFVLSSSMQASRYSRTGIKKYKKNGARFLKPHLYFKKSWQLPIFPVPRGTSIFGARAFYF